MIWESSYWTADLQKRATWLKRMQHNRTKWSKASFAVLEQQVMIGFYCIRKLLEAEKLAPRLRMRSVRIDTYPFNGQPVNSTNWDMIGLHYRLEHKSKLEVPVLWLCHQFVHSFVFIPSFRGPYGPLDGIYFNSDRKKHGALYRITLRSIISLFRNA